jgi:hypothetical protein
VISGSMRSIAVVALACLGCSSHYMPRTRGRIAVTMMDLKPVYVRDGRVYEHGVLGGGLADAVAGNPAAEAAANEYHDHMRDGLIEMFVGMGAMLGGAGYAAADAATHPNTSNRSVPVTPLIVALAGCALMIYGSTDLISAEPYRWDAINIFNDDAEAAPHLGAPGSTASATPAPAKATLHMRD